ncbi:MAG: hypothetical protein JWO62_1843 [Acidimicrobiaceae bacterium]|jgi:AcrR family transcriptional regulator|nr:hypothetical protein [Acidimicrobiaceae bacterium]
MPPRRAVPAPGPTAGVTPASRKQQILDIAAQLFAERGFLGVSIDDLGAAVGFSGPALYRHFPAKDAVLAEMLISISEDLLAGAKARVAEAKSARDAPRQLVDFHVGFALDHPALITVQSRDLGNLGRREQARVRSLQRAYVETWVDAVVRVAPGTERAAARAAVQAVIGLINSTPHSAHLDRDEMAKLLHRMALAALDAAAPCGISL